MPAGSKASLGTRVFAGKHCRLEIDPGGRTRYRDAYRFMTRERADAARELQAAIDHELERVEEMQQALDMLVPAEPEPVTKTRLVKRIPFGKSGVKRE